MVFATPFAFDSKAVLSQDLPGNHRGVGPAFVGGGFCERRLTVGCVRPELTFSLVLTPRILTERTAEGKPAGQKSPGILPRPRACPDLAHIMTVGRHDLAGAEARRRRLSPARMPKRPEKAHRYNRVTGTCAH